MEGVNSQNDSAALLEARIAALEESVKQAELELNNAEGEEKLLWANRLNQRRADLENKKSELEAIAA